MNWNIIDEMMDKFHALYDASESLEAVLTGGLWSPEAPPDFSYPYAVYIMISATPDVWNSAENPINAVIQVTIYSQSDNDEELMETILPVFQSVYDTKTGTDGTYGSYTFETANIRGAFREPGDKTTWRLDIDYNAQGIPIQT